MEGQLVRCKRWTWRVGEMIKKGGWGQVYEARSEPGGLVGAIKLVPKDPGAERELLFANVAGVRNVVPIIDDGETDEKWALVMPRAEKSLYDHLKTVGGPLDLVACREILADVAATLADLDEAARKVVHRDVKPHNVLLLDGRWCLADFGIARYSEASTGPSTRKDKWSSPYAAPERWTNETATSATDVYSFGVMAYELMVGRLPFAGRKREEFERQHLSVPPDIPATAPASLALLVDQCMEKASGARPSAASLPRRVERLTETAW
ncbi:serine/threonine protein kinase [Lentzea sp. NBC_00516]|uniref:serine/threonine-protein kinase n=1 Tax=Lentzea sp. NBC_00516 TaxID=2903582 RepID=UPI002E808501|nr:serine/threonine-protein kinase [Lentzea sp. NBC_00516]WUD26464.1 serine/threonine protein kinase [Lentzea sp. NBC_00516]